MSRATRTADEFRYETTARSWCLRLGPDGTLEATVRDAAGKRPSCTVEARRVPRKILWAAQAHFNSQPGL